RLLAGDSIGEIPPEAGTPPIVEDFKRMAKLLKLKIEDSAPKEVALDIYRKSIHRRSSRFFHSLLFLQIPFARPLAMPDFVMGKDLDRIQESWEYRWSPRTESSLIERSLYGSTIEEAAINYLCEKVSEFASEARDRNSIEGVRMLIAACRMGLHSYTDRIVDLIETSIGEDPSFISLSESMIQLTLLWNGREPMQAHSLRSVPILAAAAYRRACYLIPTLCNTLKKDTDAVVRALCNMREMLFSWSREVFDSELFIDKLKENYLQATGEPIVAGAITGILFGLNQIDEEQLTATLSTYFKNMGNLFEVGYLEGLLKSCKELAWNRGLLELIDRKLGSYDEKEFMNILPQIRLAFSSLTPRETDRVAEIVARICLRDSVDETITSFLADDDILTAAKVDEEVTLLLLHDYLDDFLN
ncbi:MAG: hypothetical protein JNN15_11795, partial [Blastocatellia bacterium]|nr:hypothetical protein [Blastocatellia bacterium]